MSALLLPRGQALRVLTGAAADTERRVREGDATLGWEGNDDMRVVFVEGVDGSGRPAGRFEVWAPDPLTREPYCCAQTTTCGPELIRELVANDTRRDGRSAVDRLLAKESKRWAAERKAMSERHEEIADKLHLALRKDLGEPPRLYAIPGGRT